MKDLKGSEYVYRLSRWILKELPITTAKAILGKATFVDFLNTPMNLINVVARNSGQRDAKLPEEAKRIEWLE